MEVVVASFKVQSRHLSSEIDENHEKNRVKIVIPHEIQTQNLLN
jgi:hypothetical protein